MIRNLRDEEKIDYILIGICIGIGLGFILSMWYLYPPFNPFSHIQPYQLYQIYKKISCVCLYDRLFYATNLIICRSVKSVFCRY